MADAVSVLTGLLYSGEMEDGQGAHGYQVKGNFQQLLSKQTELINAYNAMIAEYLELINTNDAAAVLADTGMLARLDALEAEIAGTFADGVTIRNIRVALEAGLIETSDGTDLSINGIAMSQDNEIGLMTRPSAWQSATPANGNAIAIGGKVICYGQDISNVLRLPLAYGNATYPLSLESMNHRTFIIRTGTDINVVTIPATILVPHGVELLFINMDTNDASKVIAGVTVNYMNYLRILNTAEGWLVVGSGTTQVVT